MLGYKNNWRGALAVRPGLVDINPNPVPEPTTILRLGSGLIGLIGFKRKLKET